MDFTSLFTSFSGRISRKTYWIGILLLILATFVLMFVVFAFFGIGGTLITVPVGIALIVASVALTVKRLHDRGKSGHYAWLLYGSSIVGSAIERAHPNVENMSTPAIVAILVCTAIGLWFFVELGFLRGTRGPNTYGPDPLAANA